jgi:hypothetical protein
LYFQNTRDEALAFWFSAVCVTGGDSSASVQSGNILNIDRYGIPLQILMECSLVMWLF